MKISDLNTALLTRLYETKRPMLLVGGSGIAKTSIVEAFTEAMGFGRVSFHLTSIDAPDVRGFLIPQKSDDGPVSVFTKPPIISAIEATGMEKGVLFLDEFLQADHLVQKAIRPLLTERVVGDHKLPDGWTVWAASNRPSDKAGANRILGHVTNAVLMLDVTADVTGWLSWAGKQKIHPMCMAFASSRPGVVFSADAPKDPTRPYCTPRSFTYLSEYLARDAVDMNLPSDGISTEVAQGFIGEAAAAEFFAFIKVANELPTIEQILADPNSAKLPAPDRMDAQYAAVQMCVHHSESSTVDKLFTYVERLNKELQVTAAKQLMDRSEGTLVNSQVLANWVSKNRALIINTIN
tara:strand:+ start:76 stop:1128 length:1053 start_codon:yes stop_codon:yes gene_type:complete